MPYAHPGDVVDVSISRRKDYAFGKVEAYVYRKELPPAELCSSFGPIQACGGCDWQDLSYESQLKYKLELLRELFSGKGFGVIPSKLHPSPKEFQYRNKVFMPISKSENGLDFGIYERGTHRVVTHESCRIHPAIFDTLALRVVQLCREANVLAYDEVEHRGHLRHIGIRISEDESKLLLILVTRSAKLPFSGLLVKKLCSEFPNLVGIVQNINREATNVILGSEEKLLWGEPYLMDQLLGKQFRIHYQSFWQVNSWVAKMMLSKIKTHVDEGCTLIDAYSGSGSIGIICADKSAETICIEANVAAAKDAEYNARLNSVQNIGFLCANCEDALPALLADEKSTAKKLNIVLDPPRTGVKRQVLDVLIASGVSKIIYMSCSPITLVRDLKILIDEGGYSLKSFEAYDMFPQTWHIECLAVLVKVS